MSGVRSLVRVLLPPQSQSQRSKGRKSCSSTPAQRQGVRLNVLLLSRSLSAHSFTFTHSCHTDTVIQCPRCQPLASSRCLKTGGTSVLDSPPSPLLSSASGHLCWGETGREERADSLPLKSYVHTTKTQNSFNQHASALAS